MNRETFLKELGAALSNLSRAEREEAVTYYDEMIRDAVEAGQDEETAVGRLGAPADIARQILDDAAGESAAPEPAEVPGDGVWEAGAAVHAVVVDAQDVPVRVVPGDGPVRVRFTPVRGETVRVNEEGGVFTFVQRWRPFRHLFREVRGQEIVLELPASFAGRVQADTSNAKIGAEGPWKFEDMECRTSNASVALAQFESGKLHVKTSNAKVVLTALSGNTCAAETSNSKICAEQLVFPQQLSLRTSNAKIEGAHLRSDAYVLKTSNAKILASLDADAHAYTIHSSTSNAKSNLPTDWAGTQEGKVLSAVTSNGKIEVTFLGG